MNPQSNVELRRELLTKRIQAYEFYVQGYSYEEIAEKLGYADRSGARKAVQELLSVEPVQLSLEQIRRREAGTLDYLQKKVMARPEAEIHEMVRSTVTLQKRRSALLGLDSAQEIALTVENRPAAEIAKLKAELLRRIALPESTDSPEAGDNSDTEQDPE